MICERSIKVFCCEPPFLIENYDKAINDETQTWHCHHRLEIDENKSAQQLIDEGRYYNRPASELIFLTNSDHWTLHMLNLRDETRVLHSKSQSGENNNMYGKGYKVAGEKNGMYGKNIADYMTEEAFKIRNKKISEALKGRSRSEETKQKIRDKIKNKSRVYDNK